MEEKNLIKTYRDIEERKKDDHIPRSYGKQLYKCCDLIMVDAIKECYGVDIVKAYFGNYLEGEKRSFLTYDQYEKILQTIYELNELNPEIQYMKSRFPNNLETMVRDIIDAESE